MNNRLGTSFRHTVRTLVLITGVLASSLAAAWSEEGILQGFSFKRNQIVVSDMAFSIAPNLKTYDLKGKSISALSLRKGTPVRIEIDDKDRVFRIQILRRARH